MDTILLDSSALIAGYEITGTRAEHYTVPSVKEELERDDLLKIRMEAALDSGKLILETPREQYIARVDEALKKLGEIGRISHPDRELLALGLQLRDEGKDPIILSDDYSIQNTADHLGIRYRSLSTAGIKRVFGWVIYCPGCQRVFDTPQPNGVCPVCGTTLKRKPVRKSPAKGKMRSSTTLPGHKDA